MGSATLSRRQRAARLLDASGLGALLRRLGTWRGVLVFAYHRVGDGSPAFGNPDLWTCTEEGFDAQLRVLAREAEIVGLDALSEPAALAHGRHVHVTFDDGYRDAYEVAYPLLRSRGVPATFFLATSFLDDPRPAWWDEIAWMALTSPALERLGEPGRRRTAHQLVARYHQMPGERGPAFLDALADGLGTGRCPRELAADLWLTWDMAREMRDDGMAIGGHTATHPVLARVPPERQVEEVLACGGRIAGEMGERMRAFSYPIGARDAFDEHTRAALRAAGVELAFSSYGGLARPDAWDPLDVPRASPGDGTDPAALRATVTLPGRFARW